MKRMTMMVLAMVAVVGAGGAFQVQAATGQPGKAENRYLRHPFFQNLPPMEVRVETQFGYGDTGDLPFGLLGAFGVGNFHISIKLCNPVRQGNRRVAAIFEQGTQLGQMCLVRMCNAQLRQLQSDQGRQTRIVRLLDVLRIDPQQLDRIPLRWALVQVRTIEPADQLLA